MCLKYSDCWIKSILTSEFCIAFYSTDQNKVSVSGIDNCQLCQGYCTCIYIGFLQGPFPKSGLDNMSVFPMIGLGSFYCIFKDNSVISSIPNYFNNSETPIICYKYNKPIRSTIFNFNKIVNDLDIDSNTPAS